MPVDGELLHSVGEERFVREPAAQDVYLWDFRALLGRIINPSDGVCP